MDSNKASSDLRHQEKFGPQTNIEYWGWAWCFPPVTDDIEWRQAFAAKQVQWLKSWDPPAEWMQ